MSIEGLKFFWAASESAVVAVYWAHVQSHFYQRGSNGFGLFAFILAAGVFFRSGVNCKRERLKQELSLK
jgi:hypothetical protein